MRLGVLLATEAAGSGHPTSCFSAADIVAALFFMLCGMTLMIQKYL